MILSILTGGIDLPKVSTEVASLRLAVEETNAALADHIVKANARMTTIEGVVSDNVETLRRMDACSHGIPRRWTGNGAAFARA